MGATTKQGRTRNRRTVQRSSPTGSYPQLLNCDFPVVISANVRHGSIRIDPSVPYGFTYFTGDGPLYLYSDFDSDVIPVTVTWDAGGSVWVFTNALGWAAGETYFILPWQPQLRGAKGEWFAPKLFSST